METVAIQKHARNGDGFMVRSQIDCGMSEDSRHEIQEKHDLLSGYLKDLIKSNEQHVITTKNSKLIDGIIITTYHKDCLLNEIKTVC